MEFQLNGQWWLPGNEEKVISGSLQFDQKDKIVLDLNGSFKDFTELGEIINHDIILGVSSDGKLITLYRCHESNSHISMPGYMSTSYRVITVFEGHHFTNIEDLKFDRYLISFSNLDNWTRISGFVNTTEYDEMNHISKVTVTYTFPEDRYITEIDGVALGFDYILNNNVNLISSHNLSQKTYIKLEKEGIPFQEFLNVYLYNLQNFLSLAMGTTTFPLEIKCGKNSLDEILEDGRINKKDIKVFFAIPHFPEVIKDVQSHDMPLPYQFIKDELGLMLNNWFSKLELLNPIYDLYFGTLYNSTMYLQHKFLSIIQAIESYHRRVHGGIYLDEDKYETLKNKIIGVVNEELTGELKNIFTQKLSYLNEVSLRSRLKQLIEVHQDIIDPIFKADKDFVNAVLDTRNYLTHFDESLSQKAKKRVELFYIVQKLKYMLEVCLIEQLGISKEKMLQNVIQSHKYDYVKRLN